VFSDERSLIAFHLSICVVFVGFYCLFTYSHRYSKGGLWLYLEMKSIAKLSLVDDLKPINVFLSGYNKLSSRDWYPFDKCIYFVRNILQVETPEYYSEKW